MIGALSPEHIVLIACIRDLTSRTHACHRPVLERRPRRVSGCFHRAAPVITGICARPRYHLRHRTDAALETCIGSWPEAARVAAILCAPYF